MTPLEQARPFLERAMARSYWQGDWADIEESITRGHAQLWVCGTAAAVTEIGRRADGGKSLHVTLAGGELDALLRMQASAAAWGKAQGCDRMMIDGRKGFRRALKNEGYRERAVILERAI